MVDFLSLFKSTGAYGILSSEKREKMLSHAYLVLCADDKFLFEYLKIAAKIIMCNDGEPCGRCRICTLIDRNNLADLTVYPQKGDAVLTEDITDLIEKSYIKPLEGEKRVFIINNAQSMNAAAQNKLLKTLEEPPANVHIILGATGEYSLLPTVLSRVKKLEIPAFSFERLYQVLRPECPDTERLAYAIDSGDGTVGKALALYGDDNLSETINVAIDTLTQMKSSKDVLEYSVKISSAVKDMSLFYSVIELLLRDMLCIKEGKEQLVRNKRLINVLKSAEGYSTGSVIHALEKTGEAVKRKKFNANATMVLEWLLFQILEGKYKWQKL